MKDQIGGCLMAIIYAGYVLGPFFGIYAAIGNSSFLNAMLSLFIPWYGILYWMIS